MKNTIKTQLLNLTLCIGLACSSAFCITAITGCGTVALSASSTQKIINDANKTIQVGDDAAASFLQLEFEHRATILKFTSEPRKYAHYLRQPVPDPTQILPGGGDPPTRSVPRWTGILMSARAAVTRFEANRTASGQADVSTAIATVQELITTCTAMTAKSQPGVK